MSFGTALAGELARRRAANPRYSLRAFARAAGISHSAVSRLSSERQLPLPDTIELVGRRLGWSKTRITQMIREVRVQRLEAVARSPRFNANARWLAARANLPLDEVQIALHEALRTGRLQMTERQLWKVIP